jgi:hypothetical protein
MVGPAGSNLPLGVSDGRLSSDRHWQSFSPPLGKTVLEATSISAALA